METNDRQISIVQLNAQLCELQEQLGKANENLHEARLFIAVLFGACIVSWVIALL